MNPIIRIQQLSKTFRSRRSEVRAVQDVSMEIGRGELFGLFGANGAGKSTLVRLLGTLLMPTSGTATLDGWDVCRDPLRVRASIGFVSADERSFYGRLNARQNLAFYAALQNVPRSQIDGRITRVLDLFQLQSKASAPFQSLSSGQKQKLNMARALVHDPAILILDEPTRSMDVYTSDFVKALIQGELVGRQGKTVIFISHELYEMDRFCDRVAIMAEGRVQTVGTPAELSARLPRRAIYRVEVEGECAGLLERWAALPNVESAQVISRGLTITAVDVTLSDETSCAWLEMMQVVGDLGGRVESYRRLDDTSLRDVIRFFSSKDGG